MNTTERERERVGDNLRAQRRTIWTSVSFLQAQHCHGIKNQWHFRLPFSPYLLIPFFLFLFSFFYIYVTRSRGTVIFIPRSQLYFSTDLFSSLIEKGKLLDITLFYTHTHTFLLDPSSHNTWECDGTAIRNPRRFVTWSVGRSWICRAKWNFTRVPLNKGVALSDNGRHEQRRCSTITETYSCPLGEGAGLDFPSLFDVSLVCLLELYRYFPTAEVWQCTRV